MSIRASLFALPLTAGLMLAQPSATQSWQGILVDSKCVTKNVQSAKASATDQSVMKPGDPEMNRGTRVSSDTKKTADRVADMNRDRARDVNQGTGTDAQLERTRTMEQTGGVTDRRATPNAEDYKPGKLVETSTWDKRCFIGAATSEFIFYTSDGRLMKFDGAGNSQIKSQINGRVATHAKIFRVKVDGSVAGETIQLKKIKM